MTVPSRRIWPRIALVSACLLIGCAYLLGEYNGRAGRTTELVPSARAEESPPMIGPNGIVPDRYIYYPGTEVLAKNEGARVIILNGDPTEMDDVADILLRGSISELLPRLVTTDLGAHQAP